MTTSPKRYTSEPQVVEAVQWTGDNLGELQEVFTEEKLYPPATSEDFLLLLTGVHGAQGWTPVPIGHWVVRNPDDNTDLWPVGIVAFATKYSENKSYEELIESLESKHPTAVADGDGATPKTL